MFSAPKHVGALSWAVFLVGLGLAGAAAGQDRQWINPAGGWFGDPNNWSPPGAPGAGEAALFVLGSAGYTVEFAADQASHQCAVPADHVTLDLNGRTWTLQRSDRTIVVGDGPGAAGFLEVLDGNLDGREMMLGTTETAAGSLVVGGQGEVRLDHIAWIGAWGRGEMTVENHGAVRCGDLSAATFMSTVGSVTVRDDGSLLDCGWMNVGDAGMGSLSVSNQGKVSGRAALIVGRGAESYGTVMVDGEGSEISIPWQTTVGQDGAGSVAILNGGQVLNGDGVNIGWNASGRGAAGVTGPGSRWDSPWMNLGGSGYGVLTVADGGVVRTGGVQMGGTSWGRGEAFITGPDANWSCDWLNVGWEGRGEVTVADGGLLDSRGASLGALAGSAGSVVVRGEGARWTMREWLTVGEGGRGALIVADGGVVTGTQGGLVGHVGGSEGWVKVTDAGSRWELQFDLTVGNEAASAGHMRVENGALVSCLTGQVGSFADSWGEVTVSGPDANWHCLWDTNVGVRGRGELIVTDGGTVRTEMWGMMGREPGAQGEAAITGAGSSWLIQGNLAVGNMGEGILRISRGGRVDANWGSAGGGMDSSGQVAVEGPGSTLSLLNRLAVAGEGDGSLTVLDGGTVLASDVDIGMNDQGYGRIAVGGTGARIELTGGVYVGNHTSDARLAVDAGGLVSAPREVQVRIGSGIDMGGGEIVTHNVWVDGGELAGHGRVDAWVHGHGAVRAAAGVLAIGNLAGPNVDLSGPVDVDDDAVLEVLSPGRATLHNIVTLTNGVLIARNEVNVGTLQGYGVVVGEAFVGSLLIGAPSGRVQITQPLDVGDRTARVYTNAAADLGTRTDLAGGSIEVIGGPEVLRLGAGDVLAGFGEVRADVELANAILDADGGPLRLPGRRIAGYGVVVGQVQADQWDIRIPTGIVMLNTPLDVGSRQAEVFSAGPAALYGPVTLDGGTIRADHGLSLMADLVGRGTVAAAFTGGWVSRIVATGDLRIGDWFAQTGFATSGELSVGAHRVTLVSFGPAELTGRTTLDGGELAAYGSVKVQDDGDGAVLSGHGTVRAGVELANAVLQADRGRRLEITGYVSGYGVVVGDVTAPSWPIAAGPAGTVEIVYELLNVGDQSAQVFSSGPGLLGMVAMSGGRITAPNGIGGFSSRGMTDWLPCTGTVLARMSGGAAVDVRDGLLQAGDPASPQGLAWDSVLLQVTDGALELWDADQATIASGSIRLANAVLTARNGLSLGPQVELRGSGVVIGEVAGGRQDIRTPTGRVELGTPLEVGAETARVYSAGPAVLADTHLGGGRLVAPAGVRFGDEAHVTGRGTIEADVVLDNAVLDADEGQALDITGRLAGYGIVIGQVNVGGDMDIEDPDGIVDYAGELDIGGRTATVYSQGTPEIDGPVTLAGGTLLSDSLILGDKAFVMGHGAVRGQIYGSVGSVIAADGGDLDVGEDTYLGFNTEGMLLAGSHTVRIRSDNVASLGLLTLVEGGAIVAPAGVAVGPGKGLGGAGAVEGPVGALAGSLILAQGPLALGDAGALNGFHSDGELDTADQHITLHDRNQAVLGSLTRLGLDGVGGTLSAPNGMLLAKGRNLAGFGDVHGDFENQGYVLGETPGLTFHDTVTGAGDFDGNVIFAGTYSPGNSPAVVSFGERVTFTPTAALRIELAGTDNSNEQRPSYDSLRVAYDVNLGGLLELEWLCRTADPTCRFGGTYDIITYTGRREGQFTVGGQLAAYFAGIEYAAELGGGWKAVRITLHDLVDGDADLDGLVGRSDLLAMKAAFGGSGADWFAGDFNFDGVVDGLDYLAYKDNYGRIAGGAVPEPATLALLGIGAAGLLVRRRRR